MLFPVSPGLELAVVDGTQFGCLVRTLFKREMGNVTVSPTSSATRAGRIFSMFSAIIVGCLIFNV